MSHRITMERANELYEKELRVRQMQREGKTVSNSRRQKKYELQMKKQDGLIQRMIKRIKRTGGTLPKHLQEE